eukprot:m.2129 g.2129  ORF g.2129 m.2129 type:complete len:60 (-) comp2579_c0_seq1:11-190(-)
MKLIRATCDWHMDNLFAPICNQSCEFTLDYHRVAKYKKPETVQVVICGWQRLMQDLPSK